MQQVVLTVLIPVAISFLVFFVCYIIGDFVVSKLKFRLEFGFLFHFGVSCVLGFGILANFSLILSLLNLLNTYVVWAISGLVIMFGYKRVIDLFKRVSASFKFLKFKPFEEMTLLVVSLVLFLFYLVSTFSPPYLIDAIAYHLPEARQIADGKLLSLSGYGTFGGNMPILIETLYAFLYRLHGFTLINLVHYQMLLVLLLVVYSVVKKEFGGLAGIISVIFIFAFHPLTAHATSAYIDAGTLMFELTGALLFFFWVRHKERSLLILSGAMYGLALATKYTPFYSLAVIGILFLYYNYKRCSGGKDFFYNIICFVFPAVFLGGFWYIKNLFLLGNPLYPFVFGHKGFSQEFLNSVLYDVRYLTGRPIVKPTFINYLLLPYKTFWSPYYATVLLSFVIFPFGVLLKHKKEFLRLLMFFAFCFITVWFFFISSNIHYGLIGPMFVMIVSAVVISRLADKIRSLFCYRLFRVFTILFLVIFFFVLLFFVITHKNNYIVQIKKNEAAYAFGFIDKSEFYYRNQLGELYTISNYINKNFSNSNIINNWDNFNIFLQNGNRYVSLSDYITTTSSVSWESICDFLRKNQITMMSINFDFRERILSDEWSNNKGTGEKWRKLASVEEVIISNSTIIYDKYSGRLYGINSCNK